MSNSQEQKLREKKFDAVFFQTDPDRGLYPEEIISLLKYVKHDSLIPLEIDGNYSFATGFITYEAADLLNFVYDDFRAFIRDVLDDVNKEKPENEYTFGKIRVYLNYSDYSGF